MHLHQLAHEEPEFGILGGGIALARLRVAGGVLALSDGKQRGVIARLPERLALWGPLE